LSEKDIGGVFGRMRRPQSLEQKQQHNKQFSKVEKQSIYGQGNGSGASGSGSSSSAQHTHTQTKNNSLSSLTLFFFVLLQKIKHA
jgi:hypothetical protein